MEKVNFTTEINAPKNIVWEVLWNEKSYREWTKLFCEGSYYKADWREGGRIHFLSLEGSGMYSDIEKLVADEYVSFKHRGEVKDNIEQPNDENWTDAYEIYSLTETGDKTQLTVTIDLDEKYAEYFSNIFPKVIQIVKNLSEIQNKTLVAIEALVDAPVEKVWEYWTDPKHIVNWNFASDDWCCPKAENDLQIGGTFSSRMEAKDGSMGFDFEGKYTDVVENSKISYIMGDDREVITDFVNLDGKTGIYGTFQPEATHPYEMQKDGWQAILNNFKKYAESPSHS